MSNNYSWNGPPSTFGPLQQQQGVTSTGNGFPNQTQLTGNPNIIYTTGTNVPWIQTVPYTYSSSSIGVSAGGQIPLIANGPNGKEVLRIDSNGDIITLVTDFENLKRIRMTDHIQVGDLVISLWDELYDKPGVKNTGRSLILPDGAGRVMQLFIQQQGYADMSLGEFVTKAAGLNKKRKARKTKKYKK